MQPVKPLGEDKQTAQRMAALKNSGESMTEHAWRGFRSGLSRRGLLALGAGAGSVGLFGQAFGQSSSGPPSAPKGQVVVGISQEPTVFNPLMIDIEVDQGVHWNLFSPLWGVDPDGKFFPVLATEVPTAENGGVSADGLNWHVKLRARREVA